MLEEARAVLGEAAEHEAAVAVHPRHPAHAQVQLAAAVPLEEREADQLAGIAERPTVIGATEAAGIALGVVTNLVAAVRTPIEQQMQLAAAIACHDHVLQPEFLADVVVGLRDLALVTDENPAAIPDLAQLFGEDGRVG